MKVALFAGPSGGHLYPALAFAEIFKKRHPEASLLMVTGERGKFLAEKSGRDLTLEFEFLPDCPFPRPNQPDFLIRLFPFLSKLVRAFLKSGKILDSFQPDLSVGFGSYAAFPGLLGSWRRKIPILIHEQNQKMGRANAWLACFAAKVALSFEEAGKFSIEGRAVPTGLPLRSSLVEAAMQKNSLSSPPLASEDLKILILGGSQGSSALNRLWMETFEHFSHEEKSRMAVIHITGEKDFEFVKTMYLSQGIQAQVFAFYEQMEKLYPQADLGVTRAGASTLFELALFGLPALVIPYPHADGHQDLNARYFEKEGAAWVIPERECTVVRLKEKILKLSSLETRKRLSQNLRRLARPEASEKLAEVAEELLRAKENCLV